MNHPRFLLLAAGGIFVFGLTCDAFASGGIQMLPPTQDTAKDTPCHDSAGNKILTWDGKTTIKCNKDVTISPSGAVGIGTVSPRGALDVQGPGYSYIGGRNTDPALLAIGHGATGDRSSQIQLTGDTTHSPGLQIVRYGGANATSQINHKGTGVLVVRAYDKGSVGLYTDNTSRLRVTAEGDVGIGTTSPKNKLDVAGGVKVGNDTETCTSAKGGSLRWTGTAMEYCDKKSWKKIGGGEVKVDYPTCRRGLTAPDSSKLNNYYQKWGAPAGNHNINIACPQDYVVVATDDGTMSDVFCCKLKIE